MHPLFKHGKEPSKTIDEFFLLEFIFIFTSGLDAEAAAELEAIRGNLAKYKGKMGKGFEDIAIDEMDWVRTS